MGAPKALLRLDGATFLTRVLATLAAAGVASRLVVLAAGDEAGAAEARACGADLAWNLEPDRGMLSSIDAGLSALAPARPEAVLVWPVDHPVVEAGTVALLVRTWEATSAPVVVPSWRGRRGHPALFAGRALAELRTAPADAGARAVVAAHASDRVVIPVDDPGVVADIDTPGDLARLADRDRGRR